MLFAFLFPALALALPQQSYPQSQSPFVVRPVKVPILLGVMSRCPDARVCETVWDRVLDRAGDLVDVEMVYIGKLNSDEKYGVTCMHGDAECRGNIQQLCAHEAWQGSDDEKKPWSDWWDFVQCMNYGPTSQIGDRQFATKCAKVVGHDWGKVVDECVDRGHGTELLHESVQRAAKLDITKSCTMIIGGEKVCVHDSTWKDCDNGHEVGDFVRQIREEWRRRNDGAEPPVRRHSLEPAA